MIGRRDVFPHNGFRAFHLFRFLLWHGSGRQFYEGEASALIVEMQASVEPPLDVGFAPASHSLVRRRELKEAVFKSDDPVFGHRSLFFDAKDGGQIYPFSRAVIIDLGSRLDRELPTARSARRHGFGYPNRL